VYVRWQMVERERVREKKVSERKQEKVRKLGDLGGGRCRSERANARVQAQKKEGAKRKGKKDPRPGCDEGRRGNAKCALFGGLKEAVLRESDAA
jgi:hypothetical protein